MVELLSAPFEWVCTLLFTALTGEKAEEAILMGGLEIGREEPQCGPHLDVAKAVTQRHFASVTMKKHSG